MNNSTTKARILTVFPSHNIAHLSAKGAEGADAGGGRTIEPFSCNPFRRVCPTYAWEGVRQ